MTELLREEFLTTPAGRAPDTGPSGWAWESGYDMNVSGGAATGYSGGGTLRKDGGSPGEASAVNRIRIGLRHDPTANTGFGTGGSYAGIQLRLQDMSPATGETYYLDMDFDVTNAVGGGPTTYYSLEVYAKSVWPDPEPSSSVNDTQSSYLISTTATYSDLVIDLSGEYATLSIDGTTLLTASGMSLAGRNFMDVGYVFFDVYAVDGLEVDYIVFENYVPAPLPPPPPPPPAPDPFWTSFVGSVETIKTEA